MASPMGGIESVGGAQASIDILAIIRAVLRRWKLVAAVMLSVSIATYGVVKLFVPSRYKSTVEILVYDPQQQIDATVQKPISPFVDALGSDAINTEINILKSKSVALRVASELGLDADPEFQPQSFRIRHVAERLEILAKQLGVLDLAERFGIENIAERLRIAELAGQLGLAPSTRANDSAEQAISASEVKAERLDRAADELIKRLDISQEFLHHICFCNVA